MMGPDFTRAELEQGFHIAAMRGAEGAGVAMVLRAIQAKLIASVWVSRNDATIPISALKKTGLPVLVIVGDDDYATSGPKAFKFIKPLMHWARGVIVHGAGSESIHYVTAVEGTLALGRLVMVETSSSLIGPWAVEAGAKLKQIIAPRTGMHPAIPERGAMH